MAGGVQINTKTLFPGMIQLGYSDVGTINIKQFPSVLQISKSGKLVFNGKCHIGAGCNISVGVSGKLEFGESFNCSGRTAFIAHKNIIFKLACKAPLQFAPRQNLMVYLSFRWEDWHFVELW